MKNAEPRLWNGPAWMLRAWAERVLGEEMALTGDLRNIGLADLFQTLHQNRACGVLEVSAESTTKKLLWP